MSRSPRSDHFDPLEVSVFHCLNRCVRQCFLCGVDPLTKNDYEHRKGWIEDRLEVLAAQYGIDVIGFSVMSNHFHVVLRNRPDVVATWTDEEVARRWLMLCPIRKRADGTPETPTRSEIDALVKNTERIDGHRRMPACGANWLAPLTLDETELAGPMPSCLPCRCSDKGVLSLNLEDYLVMLDWTGRQIAAGKRGAIPANLAPILKRLGIDPDKWLSLTTRFGGLFYRVAGSRENLANEATRNGRHWYQAPGSRLLSATAA